MDDICKENELKKALTNELFNINNRLKIKFNLGTVFHTINDIKIHDKLLLQNAIAKNKDLHLEEAEKKVINYNIKTWILNQQRKKTITPIF